MNNPWIDINFMMPEYNFPVLVTDAPMGEKPMVYAAVYDGANWKNIEWVNSDGEYGDLWNVAAWMPYPDPYMAQPAAPPAPEVQP